MGTTVRHTLSRIALLLVACLAFGGALLLPQFASQAHAYRAYDVWISGTQITAINQDDVLGDGSVSFEFDDSTNTGTLNLRDAYLPCAADPTGGNDAAAIYSKEGDLVLNLTGDSILETEYNATHPEPFLNGICVYDGNLSIQGYGWLKIDLNATKSSSSAPNLYGIFCNGDIDITDANLSIYTDNYGASTKQCSQFGIYSFKSCRLSNANVCINLWETFRKATGMLIYNDLDISGSSTVEVIAHDLTESPSYQYGTSTGIDAGGALVIKDYSSVRAFSNTAKVESKAVRAETSVLLEGDAYVEVDAYNNEDAKGFGVDSPSITVRNSAVLRASGSSQALTSSPSIGNHNRGGAYASENYFSVDFASPPKWDGSTALGGPSSPYTIVWIPGSPIIKRIAGDYANETAAFISQEYQQQSSIVVLARDDDFADALGATGLAGTLGAPIILTDRTSLSPAAADEINRVGAFEVFIIGGPGAMKEQLESDLQEQCGIDPESITRVYGENSYDTSLECAKEIVEHSGWKYEPTMPVYVAMSSNFQDALSISPWAYQNSVPIVLQTWGATSADRGFTSEAKEFLKDNKDITVIGGPGAISDASLSGLDVVDRIYGESGYDTSNAIAEYMLDDALSPTIVFACGAQAPKGTDALAGSGLAGRLSAPVLLLNGNTAMEAENLTTVAKFYAQHKNEVRTIYVLGGSYVVPASTFATIVDIVDAFEVL